MNCCALHIGKDVIKMSLPEKEDHVILDVNGQEIVCEAKDIIALGQAFIFILACVSPDYASQVLRFDPSEIESQTKGGRQ